jgi:Fe-S-cluster containining protein
MNADEPGPTMSEREKRWSQMGYETLVAEYGQAATEIGQGMDGGEATRRYFRRYELLQERTIAGESRANGDTLACRKGCAYCCHNRVTAPAHELLTLAERIERLPEAERAAVVERVARNAERVESMDPATAFRTPMRCALLGDDNACSVYEDRPSSCRRYHSLRLKDCEDSFFRPDDLTSRIRLSTPLLVASSAQAMAFRKVLVERGVDTSNYELHTALREALAGASACGSRLVHGEKAFLHATQYDETQVPT